VVHTLKNQTSITSLQAAAAASREQSPALSLPPAAAAAAAPERSQAAAQANGDDGTGDADGMQRQQQPRKRQRQRQRQEQRPKRRRADKWSDNDEGDVILAESSSDESDDGRIPSSDQEEGRGWQQRQRQQQQQHRRVQEVSSSTGAPETGWGSSTLSMWAGASPTSVQIRMQQHLCSFVQPAQAALWMRCACAHPQCLCTTYALALKQRSHHTVCYDYCRPTGAGAAGSTKGSPKRLRVNMSQLREGMLAAGLDAAGCYEYLRQPTDMVVLGRIQLTPAALAIQVCGGSGGRGCVEGVWSSKHGGFACTTRQQAVLLRTRKLLLLRMCKSVCLCAGERFCDHERTVCLHVSLLLCMLWCAAGG
jgi:hypothetical protein